MVETTAENGTKKSANAQKAASTETVTEALAVAAEAATEVAQSARSRFGKAIEEARAGAEVLKSEALERGESYRAKASETAGEWAEQATAYAAQAKDKGAALAKEGKTRASDALAGLGKSLSDTATMIDEKLGVQYGDYARTTARSIQETAAKLEAKDFSELAEDAKDFVRKSPATAIGIAAVAGFVLSRFLRGSDNDA